MFKLRTGMLALALAGAWTGLATATPPDSVSYMPGPSLGGPYGSNGGGTPVTGPFNGTGSPEGGCANGMCGPRGNVSTGDSGHCKTCCPHPYRHCVLGPPQIRFPRGCPAAVCPPCDAPNWGYFQPCWNPWPFPPDWSHCPAVPPAAIVVPGRGLEYTPSPSGKGS